MLYHLLLPLQTFRNILVCYKLLNKYLKFSNDGLLMKVRGGMIKTLKNWVFKHMNHYFLPKSEEKSNLNCQKFQ